MTCKILGPASDADVTCQDDISDRSNRSAENPCVGDSIPPLAYLALALVHAKERVLVRYGEHIDAAFRKLIQSPIQENADRYRWLATQQTELLRIRTGAISRWTLIGVISLNIYIVSISLAYPFLKYRIGLDEIHQWFNRVFLP